MNLLKGKTAFITGASRGIGRAIARVFAQQGADIAFTYQSSAQEAKQLVKELSSLDIKIKSYLSDASNFEQSKILVHHILNDFSTIDILVNNAGIAKDNLILRITEDGWQDVLDTNLKSVFNLTKHVCPVFLKKRQGSIINLSSIIGINGQAGQSNYAASKAGIIGFTKSIADELGSRNIRCNAIAPGFICTDMTQNLNQEKYLNQIPLRRFGKAEEVAHTALFLASDLSSYISGQVIHVCGALSR